MDRETLNEMVKFKFALRKAGGPETDLVKLAGDARYADEIFRAAETVPDEALVLLAMTLRDKFGLLTGLPDVPAPLAKTPEPAEPTPPAARYMSGARS